MTGLRITQSGPTRPLRAVVRAKNQRDRFTARLGAAKTPAARVAAAADYVRAKLADHDLVISDRYATSVVTYLTQVAAQLDKEHTG